MVTQSCVGGFNPNSRIAFDFGNNFRQKKLRDVQKRRVSCGDHQRKIVIPRRSLVKRAFLRAIAVLALLLGVGLVPASAQTGQMFGELTGKVTDAQGGVLPGVIVTLSGPAVMGTQTAITNASGQYRFPAVNTGT